MEARCEAMVLDDCDFEVCCRRVASTIVGDYALCDECRVPAPDDGACVSSLRSTRRGGTGDELRDDEVAEVRGLSLGALAG